MREVLFSGADACMHAYLQISRAASLYRFVYDRCQIEQMPLVNADDLESFVTYVDASSARAVGGYVRYLRNRM